ncbi:MAG: hypothetical protein AAF399_07920 [Bacteroidota bacterium]
MKKTLLLIVAGFLMIGSSLLHAQGISYQAVARNAQGQLMANEDITVIFAIQEAAAGGTTVYSESHAVTTNNYALFSVVIGKGTSISGDFSTLDWGGNDHFLNVQVDGTDMGTTQLETVPYSKVATAMQISQLTDVSIGAAVVNDVLKYDGTNWVSAPDAVDDADADPANELQSLSLNGTDLELNQGGGTVDLSGLAGDSPWTTVGTDITYNNGGNVGIGVADPGFPLHIEDDNQNVVHLEHTGTSGVQDILELEAGANFTGQFIEFQDQSGILGAINADGSAEFTSVTVEETLTASTTPATGQVYANGLPLAYGYITFTGSISTDFGIVSVATPATGTYTITLNKSWVGDPVILATSFSSSIDSEIISASPVSGQTNQIEINIAENGQGVNSAFYFVVFGTAQ